MRAIRLSPKPSIGIILAVFLGVALYLRIVPPYDHVFSGDWIKFTGVDAYHYMRQVDNLVHNFPQLMHFDPYMRYPRGLELGAANFFVYLLSCIIWLAGLGSPTQHTVDIIGVYFPAIVGAFTIIPVYFIGKELFNRWAGVIAAGLTAILPSQFLWRSTLGFTDRDAVEAFFTAATMLFLVLAIKTARQKQLNFDCLRQRDWGVITKPLIYSLLAGILLGVFLLTWKGALLIVFTILIYFIIQSIIDYLRHHATDYLCFIGVIVLLVALILSLPGLLGTVYLAFLSIAVLITPILSIISWLMTHRKIKTAFYPLTVVVLGLAGLAIFRLVNPPLFSSMLTAFRIFAPMGVSLTISEMQPLLTEMGHFSLAPAWAAYTTSFFLSFISLGILIYLVIKQDNAEKPLLVLWSLVMLAANLGQRRFGLLFTINVALLTGYFSWLVLHFAGLGEKAAAPHKTTEKGKIKKVKPKKAQEKGGFRFSIEHVSLAAVAIVIFFLVFFPNILRAVELSKGQSGPTDGWCESLSWLRDNTPDPFGDPDSYYSLYETPFQYPETAYGVAAWWDYGYQIIRTGHRLPNCDPGGGSRGRVGRLFTAQNEASAKKIMRQLDSKYIIIDYGTVTGLFYAVATYAGSSEEKFSETYYHKESGNIMVPVHFFYPEYYRSLAVRLYNFDGGDVTPQSSTVISYEEKVRWDGMLYKEVISEKSFPGYEEAEAYVLNHESGNYRIVSNNPFVSPVPLEALKDYKLIHSSDSRVTQKDVVGIPEVKIFEYNE